MTSQQHALNYDITTCDKLTINGLEVCGRGNGFGLELGKPLSAAIVQINKLHRLALREGYQLRMEGAIVERLGRSKDMMVERSGEEYRHEVMAGAFNSRAY